MGATSDATQILVHLKEGDKSAYNKLFSIVYEKLKDIAMKQLRKEYGKHTLSRTELVHEVFLRLVDQTRVDYKDINHFYAIAARSMRQILVDYARKKKAQKRGGDQEDLSLDETSIDIREHASQIINMDSLLEELLEMDERLGKIVELRFFAGFSIEETANMLNISASTANRDWAKAKGWLYQRLHD